MLKRLLQSLGLGEKPKHQRRPAGRPMPAGSGHKRCRNCAAILPASAFRCSACGARLVQPQAGAAPEEVVPAPASTGSTPQLGDLERRILLSANVDPSTRIVTLPPGGGAPGEVKAGPDRFEGDDALTAIDALLRRGYIAEWGDGSYTLTPEGMTQADKVR